MISIQNVYCKAIIMCLIPILVGDIYDGIICSKAPFKGSKPINEVKESWLIPDLILSTVSKNMLNMTNSADPDETPLFI